MRFILFPLLAISIFSQEKVIGVGSAIVDLIVQVDDDFIVQHIQKTKGGSYHLEPHEFAKIIEKLPNELKISPGGSAGNTIRALSKLGLSCSHLCHVGMDPYGKFFAEKTDLLGIGGVQADPNFATFCIICLITPDGERTFIHSNAARDWGPTPKDLFLGAAWVHFEGFLFWDAPVQFEECLKMARDAGAVVSFDLSNFAVVQKFKNTVLRYLDEYVDVVFGNEEEIKYLTGLDAKEGCKKLQEICSIALVTRGKNSCFIGHKGEILEIPGCPTPAIDTTGAGDYFSAGFIYGSLKHYPLFESVQIGHRMGSAIVQFIGTDLPEERWEIIRSMLNEIQQSKKNSNSPPT